MTAEILIMNKSAIALAADSAVTVNNKITYEGVNKLFMLSNNPPMGIMIYGNADFMDIPMETLIKEYRKNADFKKNNSVKKIMPDFLNFITEYGNKYITVKDDFLDDSYETFKDVMFLRFLRSKNSAIEELKLIASNIDDEFFKIFTDNNFFNKVPPVFDEIIQHFFKDADNEDYLIELLEKCYVQGIPNTGVVIAGFNEEDIFPSFSAHQIFILFNKKLLSKEFKSVANINVPCIQPFAQRDVVDSFLTGMDSAVLNSFKNFLGITLNNYSNKVIEMVNQNQKLKPNRLNEVKEDIQKVNNENDIFLQNFDILVKDIKKKYTRPILEAIDALPKDELGSMCESLIHLTSLKRKVSGGLPTVGGDIDVAIISKGDGFIWTKRKHYFDAKYNYQFFENHDQIANINNNED